jgi:hypothetical protein
MDLKHTLLTFITGALLMAPVAAFADHDDDRSEGTHRHGPACNHGPAPLPPPHVDRGRYEIRLVRTWVEGTSVRDWVPERCVHKPHGRIKCKGGHYVDRWVPGHFEQIEKWVWVPYAPRPGWQVSIRY